MEELPLAGAMRMLETALAHARRRDLPPLAVVVLDRGGHARVAAREDGAGHAGIAIATAKARGALAFGMSSREVGEIFGANAALTAALSATLEGQMLPLAGAVLVKAADGRVVGAISAAGGMPQDDEAAAAAGSAAFGAA